MIPYITNQLFLVHASLLVWKTERPCHEAWLVKDEWHYWWGFKNELQQILPPTLSITSFIDDLVLILVEKFLTFVLFISSQLIPYFQCSLPCRLMYISGFLRASPVNCAVVKIHRKKCILSSVSPVRSLVTENGSAFLSFSFLQSQDTWYQSSQVKYVCL